MVPSSTESAVRNGRLRTVRWAVVPFLVLYAAGYFFPQTWWGTHFLLFLPYPAVAAFAGAALFLILKPSPFDFLDGYARAARDDRRSLLILVLFSAACAFAYYFLSTETDIYGDARRNLRFVTGKTDSFDPVWLREIFRINIFDRATGESLVLNLVLLAGWILKLDGPEAFGVVNASFGFVFALAWSLFVRSHIRAAGLRVVMTALGVTAGFAAVFTDHAEVYAAGTVFLLLYLMVNVQCLTRPGRWSMWLLPVCLFLAVRSFFGNNVLWAPFLVTMAYVELKRHEWFNSRFNRKWIILAVIIPIIAGFAVYYLFVAGNYDVSRYVSMDERHRTMFLPLVHAEPEGVPRYTIFSLYHVIDFINLLMLWSAPALFVVLGLWLSSAGKGRFNSPELLVAELALVLYLFAFFVTNPLLSMPRDWDLFSMAAPALLVYSVLLLAAVQDKAGLLRRITGSAAALILLGLPAFIVNNDKDLLTNRLEMVGLRTYETYFYGASYILNVAVSMSEDDPDEYLRRRIDVVEKARPYKLEADDDQFADLTFRLAELYVGQKDYTNAKKYLFEAFYEKPRDQGLRYCLAQVHYSLGEYLECLLFADELSKKLPDEPDIHELSFLAAYRAGETEKALVYGRRYLSLKPGPGVIKTLVDSLSTLEQNR